MREGQLGDEIENYESYLNPCTLRGIPIRSDTMKPQYLVLNSNLMIPDFPHNIRIRFAR